MKMFTLARDGMNSLILRLALIAAFASMAMMAQAQATVQTDLLDYPPGSTAIITGSGFQAGEDVVLQVVHADRALLSNSGATNTMNSGTGTGVLKYNQGTLYNPSI